MVTATVARLARSQELHPDIRHVWPEPQFLVSHQLPSQAHLARSWLEIGIARTGTSTLKATRGPQAVA